MPDDDARRRWVDQAAETLRHGGWSVTSNVLEWLEQYYDERSPAVAKGELNDQEFGQILRRLLERFRIPNGSSVG
jgi:hypothetical protein